VARVEGIRRVRFTSPHPVDVSDDLLDVMASEEAVCPQLHLPVQSGSDRILKRMVRRYTRRQFLDVARAARRRVTGLALSTDVIVGFPGETEEDFAATLSLLEEVRFDDAYLYRYSPREGTPATRFPAADFVDERTSGARLERLIAMQRGIQREIQETEIGGVCEVLVEREARSEGDLLGRTTTGKSAVFGGDPSWVGSYRRVRLVGTTGSTFLAVAEA
jgi:tRNA-2-methylthio-N6-dimethylallyladenosine synthase